MAQMKRIVAPSLVSLCIGLGVLATRCDKPKSTPPVLSSEAPDGSRIKTMRADWLERAARFPALPECGGLAIAERSLCTDAIAKREALVAGEKKDMPDAEHLKLAADAADAAAAVGEKLEVTYMQKLVFRSGPRPGHKAHPAPSGAPSAGPAPSVAAPAPSGSSSPRNGVMAVIEAAKRGEARERDPLQTAAFQFYSAERDALLRIAGYVREGAPAEREQAIQLLQKHSERHPKSARLRQLLNETIILASDQTVRDRLRKIRTKMGPGAVPSPSASADRE
jgi:hypothetical protein